MRDDDTLIGPSEVQHLLGFKTPVPAWRARRRPGFPVAIKLPGVNGERYRLSEIRAYIEQHRATSKAIEPEAA